MVLQPKSFEEPETFHCRAFGERMSIFNCMQYYVDANALNQSDKPCFKCTQGTEIRTKYAKG